jgi:alpha-tubulin suppressor-like RCC1 family protein
VPVPANGIQLAADVAAGDNFSCARRKDGTVACWGDDRLGQLGTAAVIRRLGPTPVAVLTDARAVSAAGDHTCALQRAGVDAGGAATWATYCWGHNQAGELGDGTRLDRPGATPLKIAIDAIEIASGQSHTCLRAADASVWCWGRGGSGQLGTPSLIDFLIPASVGGVSGATAIAAGGAHTCALEGGQAFCWGANEQGQLGDGGDTNQPKPVAVQGLVDASALRLGAAHTCALRLDGTVVCWGANDHGQLGRAPEEIAASATPVAIGNLSGVVSLAAGDNHTCAVDGDGNASCWGAGKSGQLGWTATPMDHGGATLVAGVTGAVEIAAGAAHTCARLTSDGQPGTPGSVLCWGDNSNGQLGDGTLELRPVPVTPVVGLTDAVAITAGNAHLRAQAGPDAGVLGVG